MAENGVQVLLRIRPSNLTQPASNSPSQSAFLNINSSSVSFDRQQKGVVDFSFSGVLGPDATQEDLFERCKMSDDIYAGISCCVIAYGQTSSGKTYSMYGLDELSDSGGSPLFEVSERNNNFVDANDRGQNISKCAGIVSRSVTDLFEVLDRKCDENENIEYAVHCQIMQIYNEKIFDLLRDKGRKNPLQVREGTNRENANGNSVYVKGLSVYRVYSKDDVAALLRRAMRHRAIRATEMNIESSRCHTILQLFTTVEEENASGVVTTRNSTLSLVDLAGSEKWRAQLSQAGNVQADAQKEMTNINTSLHVLGNCVSALIETNRRHIPYRDSILTRLLQDCLGGQGKTTLIATVHEDPIYREETFSTLQFASRASRIKMVVRSSSSLSMLPSGAADSSVTTLQEALKRIALLQSKLAQYTNGNQSAKISDRDFIKFHEGNNTVTAYPSNVLSCITQSMRESEDENVKILLQKVEILSAENNRLREDLLQFMESGGVNSVNETPARRSSQNLRRWSVKISSGKAGVLRRRQRHSAHADNASAISAAVGLFASSPKSPVQLYSPIAGAADMSSSDGDSLKGSHQRRLRINVEGSNFWRKEGEAKKTRVNSMDDGSPRKSQRHRSVDTLEESVEEPLNADTTLYIKQQPANAGDGGYDRVLSALLAANSVILQRQKVESSSLEVEKDRIIAALISPTVSRTLFPPQNLGDEEVTGEVVYPGEKGSPRKEISMGKKSPSPEKVPSPVPGKAGFGVGILPPQFSPPAQVAPSFGTDYDQAREETNEALPRVTTVAVSASGSPQQRSEHGESPSLSISLPTQQKGSSVGSEVRPSARIPATLSDHHNHHQPKQLILQQQQPMSLAIELLSCVTSPGKHCAKHNLEQCILCALYTQTSPKAAVTSDNNNTKQQDAVITYTRMHQHQDIYGFGNGGTIAPTGASSLTERTRAALASVTRGESHLNPSSVSIGSRGAAFGGVSIPGSLASSLEGSLASSAHVAGAGAVCAAHRINNCFFCATSNSAIATPASKHQSLQIADDSSGPLLNNQESSVVNRRRSVSSGVSENPALARLTSSVEVGNSLEGSPINEGAIAASVMPSLHPYKTDAAAPIAGGSHIRVIHQLQNRVQQHQQQHQQHQQQHHQHQHQQQHQQHQHEQSEYNNFPSTNHSSTHGDKDNASGYTLSKESNIVNNDGYGASGFIGTSAADMTSSYKRGSMDDEEAFILQQQLLLFPTARRKVHAEDRYVMDLPYIESVEEGSLGVFASTTEAGTQKKPSLGRAASVDEVVGLGEGGKKKTKTSSRVSSREGSGSRGADSSNGLGLGMRVGLLPTLKPDSGAGSKSATLLALNLLNSDRKDEEPPLAKVTKKKTKKKSKG